MKRLLEKMDMGFLLWGALWGLAEIFLWDFLRSWGVGFRASWMASLALFFMAAAGAKMPFFGLLAAGVAVGVKALFGVHYPCAFWAVLSLGAAWELFRWLGLRLGKWSPLVLAIGAPGAMLAFILAVNPAETLRYAVWGGVLAYVPGVFLTWAGLALGKRLALDPVSLGRFFRAPRKGEAP